MGTTHLVIPDAWLRRGGERAAEEGYRPIASVAGRSIVAVPPRAQRKPSLRLRAPASAAAGRWLTLSVYQSEPSLHTHSHESLSASWRSEARTTRVKALALIPGIVGPQDPILIHVPAPDEVGRYELTVDFPLLPIEATVEVRGLKTTADQPIHGASVALADGYAPPDAVRAGGSFRVVVRIEAGSGPVLLASSIERLPDRRGETLVVYRLRPRGPGSASGAIAQPGLSGDLTPGEVIEQTWHLSAPAHPGNYDLLVRLAARGMSAMPMPWIELMRDLTVVPD